MSELEPAAGIFYRICYGIARDLAEARTFSMISGRAAAAAELGREALAECRRRHGPLDQAEEELAREAIDDAVRGRRPRW